MNRIYRSVFLKRALLADAVVSGATAALQLAGTERLTTALELPRSLLVGTAEFMLIYAAALVYMATRQRLVAPRRSVPAGAVLSAGLRDHQGPQRGRAS